MVAKPEGLSWAYYSARIGEFLRDGRSCLAELARYGAAAGSVEGPQMGAWEKQVECLQRALQGMDGRILFEFVVPRIGSRIDVVLLLERVLVVMEFKVSGDGAVEQGTEGYRQVWDYGLDLKNFHKGSHDLEIVPILVSPKGRGWTGKLPDRAADGVYAPIWTNLEGVRGVLEGVVAGVRGKEVKAEEWEEKSYQPTPSIIQAAQAVFSGNTVDHLLLNEAKENLGTTFRAVEEIIEGSRERGEKAICFVTGVPGAGKTLVGMQVAARRREGTDRVHATFLSGNMPLVEVLTEALVRDRVRQIGEREGGRGKGRKGRVRGEVKALIQHKMHFRDAGLKDRGKPPSDRIVIFDEAQRAWNLQQTRSFMIRKRKMADFQQSEPQFLLDYMNHHVGWAVVICLVGGGQEIHDGEAGIGEWLRTVREQFPGWRVYVSPQLGESEFAAGRELKALEGHGNFVRRETLHLAVSNRSFRAEKVSHFVRALLDGEEGVAREALEEFRARYPIRLTREMGRAKEWIRGVARGTERYGMLASSSADRLKPEAVNVKGEINAVHWFLHGAEDIRSSYYLEDPATEFQVQGLEVDWALVAWDGDFRRVGREWIHRSFVGSKWQQVKKEERQRYLKNTYRVLLTRARQGMVIYVPKGDARDPTRVPEYYDGTYKYLRELGVEEI